MRVAPLVTAAALLATAAIVSPVAAQQRTTPADTMTMTPGPIMRVVLFRATSPENGQEVAQDLRRNLLPVWEDEKTAGVLLSYSVFTNQTTNSPDDWTGGYSLVYPNWAALDSLNARTGPITLRHYGTAEARTAAGNRRNQIRTIVSSQLTRLQTVGR